MFWADLKHLLSATTLAVFGFGFAAGLVVGGHEGLLWIVPAISLYGAIRRGRRDARAR